MNTHLTESLDFVYFDRIEVGVFRITLIFSLSLIPFPPLYVIIPPMKPVKGGILKKKAPLPSEILQEESKRMEERLIELREHMKQEKERRQSEVRFKDGSRWRSAVTTKPMHGYAEVVLKAKPKPPRPTSKGFIPTSDLLNYEPEPGAEAKMAENLKRANTLPPAPAGGEDVKVFLESCGLEKHYETLTTNGVEEMEVLLELTEEHLANLGLPLGHRIKLLKRIREAKAMPSFNSDLEALPAPSQAIGTEPTSEGGALLKGEYNEAESYALFKDALDQFRRGGTTTQHLSSPKDSDSQDKIDSKRVRFADDSEGKEKKVWMTGGDLEWQPAAATISTAEEGTDAVLREDSQAEGLMNVKVSCWECFKVSAATFVEFDTRKFCSEVCKDAYQRKTYAECACGTEFIKRNGELVDGTWYCSEACPAISAAPDPQIDSNPLIEDEENIDDLPDDFMPIDPTTGDPITI